MSGVVDVGEAFELTFAASPGAQVTTSFLNPMQVAVIDGEHVAEVPANSGKFPRTFIPSSPGVWTVWFHGPGQPERYYVRAAALSGPPPFAAIGDVATQFVPGGTLTAAQEGLAGHLVRAASALLRHRARQLGIDLDADLAAGRVDQELAALTVTNMVLRVMRNPEGLRAKTVGPFSRTYDTSAAAGQLVVTADDLAAVAPGEGAEELPAGTAGMGIGTIRVQPTLAPPPGPRTPFRPWW